MIPRTVDVIHADGRRETLSVEDFRRQRGIEVCPNCGTPHRRDQRHGCAEGQTATPEAAREAARRRRAERRASYLPQGGGVDAAWNPRDREEI